MIIIAEAETFDCVLHVQMQLSKKKETRSSLLIKKKKEYNTISFVFK